jgi:cell division protein FtsB
MFQKLTEKLPDKKTIQTVFDLRNVGLYIFALLVLSVTWSSARTLQQNYELQKKVAVLEQQNQVFELQNKTIELRNKYLKSDEFVELEARRQTGKGLPDEKVLLVPKEVALSRTVPPLEVPSVAAKQDSSTRPWYAQNIRDWFDFFRGQLETVE